jgi:selenocysteine-specific elongation factor
MKYFVVGTAGHIDHGKSSLVLALTGTDPDRLQEEKRRGITIDLGFAHLDLGEGLRVAFVDVPGHERFVKNMLAGASGIDAVLLVVAADESIKPQTREHFEICKLLGVRSGMVALTKADVVENDILDLVRMEVQEFVASSFLEGCAIVPTSVRTGRGLDELRAELRRLGGRVAQKPADLPFRLPIDRAFVMKGFGCVVTGTLVSGRLEVESEVELYPTGRRSRVRGIQVHGEASAAALAGQRSAVNLAGIEARDVQRGMALAPPGLFTPTQRADCSLNLMLAAKPLKNRSRVHFHCGTAEMLAEVVLIGAKEAAPGGQYFAQLRLAEPILLLPGDRFIIRQFSPVITIGGGTVIDNLAERHRTNDNAVAPFLEALESGDGLRRVELLVKLQNEIPVTSLAARCGWHAAVALELAARLQAQKKALLVGTPPAMVAHADYFKAIAAATLATLEKLHKANPLLAGFAKEDLRDRVAKALAEGSPAPSAPLFQAVLAHLVAGGRLEMRGEVVLIAGQGVQMSAEEAQAKAAIEKAFASCGLKTPGTADVLAGLQVDRARAEKILQILLREKVLVKVADGLIFHRAALEELRRMMSAQRAKSDRISVPGFKELTGVTRKYAIPLLEYLDRERVTRRAGDERIIL